jgi:hypothetical protein
MNATTKEHTWSKFLNFFTQQNLGRPTRLGIFEKEGGVSTDYWIEAGLPLLGIDVDTRSGVSPSVEIMLGGTSKADTAHLTHVVTQIQTVKIVLGCGGASDGLEINDAEGKTTILRFED